MFVLISVSINYSLRLFLRPTGYIDLSKRRVSNDDVAKCEEKFSRAKAVNQILMRVAGVLGYDQDSQLEELYNKTAWHFDRKAGRPAAAFDVFKSAVT